MSVSWIAARCPAFAAAAFAAAALLFAVSASAQSSGSFNNLAGTWEGGGSIGIRGSGSERIRCRADYRVGGGGDMVVLKLRCASDSYKFELHGNVRNQNGEVRGDWSESTRGTAGLVAGRIKGDLVEVRVEGPTFAALLSLTTRGDKQSISIKTPAGSDMSGANITLNRRG